MNDDRASHEDAFPQRGGARRRAAQAEVANYIHDLSDRHADAAADSAPRGVAPTHASDDDA